MTRMTGATVAQFKESIETMRKVYPFEDDKTYIVNDSDPLLLAHTMIEITTKDVETGVKVNLSKEMDGKSMWEV